MNQAQRYADRLNHQPSTGGHARYEATGDQVYDTQEEVLLDPPTGFIQTQAEADLMKRIKNLR